MKFSDADGGWRKALDAIVEMNTTGCYQEGVVAGDFAAITNGLATGNSYSAAIPAGAAFGLVAEAPGNTFVVDAMPGITKDNTIIFASPNNSIAMAAAAPDAEKAAAHAFLDWLAQPENLAAMQATAGWLPLEPKADQLPPPYAPIAPYLASGKYVPAPQPGLGLRRGLRRAGHRRPRPALRADHRGCRARCHGRSLEVAP